MMKKDMGAFSGSREPDPASGSGPSGFDPAREREIRLRAIEEVIGWIEETSFREVCGILAKRKRAREDAELRGQTIREERADLIRMIRARLENESGTTIRALREIRDGTFGHSRGISHYDLMDAAILADRKLITLTATMTWGGCSWNTTTADTEWRAAITDKGLAVLDAIATEAGTAETPKDGSVHEGGHD